MTRALDYRPAPYREVPRWRRWWPLAWQETTVLFRTAKAIERAVSDLKAGKPMAEKDAMGREAFEQAIGKPVWTQIEKKFKR